MLHCATSPRNNARELFLWQEGKRKENFSNAFLIDEYSQALTAAVDAVLDKLRSDIKVARDVCARMIDKREAHVSARENGEYSGRRKIR